MPFIMKIIPTKQSRVKVRRRVTQYTDSYGKTVTGKLVYSTNERKQTILKQLNRR